MHRVAIVDGVRTPFMRSWGVFWGLSASDLSALTFQNLIAKVGINPELIDEVILGNVAPPEQGGLSARIALKRAGFPDCIPGHTTNRNCGSGMQAIAEGFELIRNGSAKIILAGGAESMSNSPLLYNKKAQRLFLTLRTKKLLSKVPLLTQILRQVFSPTISLEQGLYDPISGLNMGQTATNLAHDFGITRSDQDEFGCESHMRAAAATKSGRFAEELMPVFLPPDYKKVVMHDDGFRDYATKEAGRAKLAGLKTIKEFHLKEYGPEFATLTAGNSSQITDGAAAVLLMRDDIARARGLKPLGYIIGYSFVGCDPSRMGLGPVFAMSQTLTRCGMTLREMGLVEINEAFAAQVLACERAIISGKYRLAHLGREGWRLETGLDRTTLNVNGGAVALGHPVGASGTRIVLTLLKEMQLRNVNLGMAALCIGGGQGGAMIVQKEEYR